MRQLFMKQMVSGEKDNFTIKDRRGEEVYTVAFDETDSDTLFSISNHGQQPVVLIKEDEESCQKRYCIHSEGQEIFIVEADETLVECRAISDELSINGDMLSMTFDVMYGYRKVGKIRKRWIPSENSYELTIFESDREGVLLGLMACLDFTMCCPSNY
ncbi:hypothetical protein DOK76_05715 [Vagococcus sp. DIV0080]|uniref:DUF1934 domain-containing protein n=1 Tax=Candidatus Vagococcus giribetii TaxID=2230876 RepID=A0ABS3HS16_9ENTE|nr:hypothetical protein [Vagococcus sp. DIV0080]MBO0476558.1 hypothetical protein [Vagococcus sp. DIV0080]